MNIYERFQADNYVKEVVVFLNHPSDDYVCVRGFYIFNPHFSSNFIPKLNFQ